MSAATNNALADVVDKAVDAVTSRAGAINGGNVSAVEGTFVEWMKGLLRKEWRVECLDLVIRL